MTARDATSAKMTGQERCPVCQHPGMSVFIEINAAPAHCNLLLSSRKAALEAPRGDIRLGFCRACGAIHNLSFDPDLMRYTQQYENSLHHSPKFQEYAGKLARQLIEKYDLHSKQIIEIGCGKGEFLSMLCEGGQNRGVGFDPSYDGATEAGRATGAITFIRDFYSEAYADYAADLICCRQVLEHIQYPRDFLLHLRRAVGDRRDTAVFFEVPNVLYTLRDFGIWDIIHEHCSYFSASSLTRVFAETGFKTLHLYESYGGQFLCIEALPNDYGCAPPGGQPELLREMSGLVSAFAQNYRNKVESWQSNLKLMAEAGRRAVVWGAGSKGVMFLNTLKVTDQIEFVVDVNPHKQGTFVVGTGQRIVPPTFLQQYQPDLLLVMNPAYRDEVAQMVSLLGLSAELMTV